MTDDTIILSPADSRIVAEALANPPPPNEALKRAAERRRRLFEPMSDEQQLQMLCDGLRVKHRCERVTITLEFENGSLTFESGHAANDR